MKKSLMLLSLSAFLGIGGLVSCATTPKNKTVLTRSESLSMQAATSLSMVNDISNANTMSLKKSADLKEKDTLTDAEKEDIKKILPTLDLMLSNNSSFDTVLEKGNYTPVIEDNTLTFNTKEVISFLGTDSKSESYVLYYNVEEDKPAENEETLPPVQEAKDLEAEPEEEDKDEEDDKTDENKIETEEKISGLAFLNEDTYYPFDSKVEKEIEADETEEERTFKILTAEKSYIEVKQEHEVEGNEVETEFKYKVVENGSVTLEYSISIENEDNQLELEYEIGEVEYELVKEVVDGETIYHVEYENDANDAEALISFKKLTDEETGEVSYEEII